jgi:hypothetical protein
MNIPIPGSIVQYHPIPDDGLAQVNSQPLAAIVTYVFEQKVHLCVFDLWGMTTSRLCVDMVQAGETPPEGKAYAAWPDTSPSTVAQATAPDQPVGVTA